MKDFWDWCQIVFYATFVFPIGLLLSMLVIYGVMKIGTIAVLSGIDFYNKKGKR